MNNGIYGLVAFCESLCKASSDETIFKGTTPVFRGVALGNTNSSSNEISNGSSLQPLKNEI
jgi:hypothetical protein